MTNITPLTPASLGPFVTRNRLALIHFWATWNRYDQEQQRIIEQEIPCDLAAHVAFGSFDVDPPEHHSICRDLKILNIPFLALYQNGVLVFRRVGVLSRDGLMRLLREHTSVSSSS